MDSKRLLACALLLLGAVGCPKPAAQTTAIMPDAAPTDAATTEPAAELAPSLRVVITPKLEPSSRVAVTIEVTGPAKPDASLRAWSLPGPIAEAGLQPIVHDADGAVGVEVSRDDAGVHATLGRDPTPPLTIAYELAPVSALPGRSPRVTLDEVHMFATGEALLLLPDDALDRRLSLSIELVPDVLAPSDDDAPTGMPPLRAASSFAAEREVDVDGWIFELRRAAFVAGLVEWARFDSMAGDDRWLGLGPTRFDHRWAAAELAGIRSTIDGSIGVPTVEPMVTMLVSDSRSAFEPPFSAELRGRGLLLVASEDAYWDANARMTATQALAARWIGGRVRMVDDPRLEHGQTRALWWDAGTTRFVAREALYAIGLMSDEDYAAELDRIELELELSPLRERTLTELAALAASEDPDAVITATDARALLAARGAMYMAWLDAELRSRPSNWTAYGVSEVLRVVIATALAEERRDLRLAELIHPAALVLSTDSPPDERLLAMFERVVVRGQRPALRDNAFGPCFRPVIRNLRRFELGFVDSTRPGDEQPSFTALDPDGPAAKAGLRADDVMRSLDYVNGSEGTYVRITVERDGAPVDIRYRPAGPVRRVTQWEHLANVSPDSCVR